MAATPPVDPSVAAPAASGGIMDTLASAGNTIVEGVKSAAAGAWSGVCWVGSGVLSGLTTAKDTMWSGMQKAASAVGPFFSRTAEVASANPGQVAAIAVGAAVVGVGVGAVAGYFFGKPSSAPAGGATPNNTPNTTV